MKTLTIEQFVNLLKQSTPGMHETQVAMLYGMAIGYAAIANNRDTLTEAEAEKIVDAYNTMKDAASGL